MLLLSSLLLHRCPLFLVCFWQETHTTALLNDVNNNDDALVARLPELSDSLPVPNNQLGLLVLFLGIPELGKFCLRDGLLVAAWQQQRTTNPFPAQTDNFLRNRAITPRADTGRW